MTVCLEPKRDEFMKHFLGQVGSSRVTITRMIAFTHDCTGPARKQAVVERQRAAREDTAEDEPTLG